jgi:hypothetical protein
MGQDKKTPITIDDVEYVYEDLTPEQQALVNHCMDLDRKINSTKFNLDQLSIGKDAFLSMLKSSLEVKMADDKQDVIET